MGLRKLDEDALVATVLAKSLCSPREGKNIRDSAEWIGVALEEASDASMPRSRVVPEEVCVLVERGDRRVMAILLQCKAPPQPS
jgi:hypothetical protein